MLLARLVNAVRGWLTALVLAASVWPAHAQTVQVMPFGGYRFGGDLYEAVTGTELDLDGAPAAGIAIDVPIGEWDTIMLGKEKTTGAKFVEQRASDGELFQVFQLKDKTYVAQTKLG